MTETGTAARAIMGNGMGNGMTVGVAGHPAAANSDAHRIPDLAVIIPTLNEAGNVARIIGAVDRVLAGVHHEIIFVDDWSRDGTVAEIAAIAAMRPNVRVISRYGRRGLASAVVEGAMATFAPIVAVIDADMQHDERVLPQLFALVHSGDKDIAIGSRYCTDGGFGEWKESRKTASKLATRVANAFLPKDVSDPMSGLFAVRRDIIVDAVPNLSQMGFKILLDILMTDKSGLRVGEVPYTFRTREVGESKLDGTVIVDFAMLLLDKKLGRWISPRLIFFGAIGALGLVVHLTILSAMMKTFGAGFATGQTVAVAGAIAFNFLLNNELTYRDRRLRGFKFVTGLASFYLICSLGAVANVGAGSLAFANQYSWWVAGIAGAIVGSAWNFMASRLFTWRK